MPDIKYIYFETYGKVRDSDRASHNCINHKIQNVNVLMLKPETNSSGYWQIRHVTKGDNFNICVDQYWVYLDKFNAEYKERCYWTRYLHGRIKEAMEVIEELIKTEP